MADLVADGTAEGTEVRAAAGLDVTVRVVTLTAGMVVGLTFLFGFGNVWALAIRLGVPPWVAPLVAPAVDLSVVGLLLGTRYLAVHGASRDQLRSPRRLLIFSSTVTLALNVAEPIIAGDYGKAAFDAVGPLLLIGWSEVGPGLLQAMNEVGGAAPTPSAGRPLEATGGVQPAAFAKTGRDTGAAGSAPVPEQGSGGGPRATGGGGREDACWNGPGQRTRATGSCTSVRSRPRRCVGACTSAPLGRGPSSHRSARQLPTPLTTDTVPRSG